MNLLRLPADPSSDLNWPIPTSKGVWYLDFGFADFDPFDVPLFNSHMLAVEEFSKRFYQSKKVFFAKLNGEFLSWLKRSEKLEERYEEMGGNFEVFAASIFSQYLHRLASVLPEETQGFIYLDLLESSDFASLVLLFCKRRFEHFQFHFSQLEIPIQKEASVLVSLPQDSVYNPLTFQSLFDSLASISYKCIPEEMLNEYWVGVDYLIVDSISLGEMGERMLNGFDATGGQIVCVGGPLGFGNEISLEQFLINYTVV